MSSGTKRPVADARRDADAFRTLFGGMFDRWDFAGSVRRGMAQVGDVEHVVLPKLVDGERTSLFAATGPLVNAVFQKLDELVRTAPDLMSKHAYSKSDNGAPVHRWGHVYRGVDFRGHLHELFCAAPDNYGPTLAIRTGPPDFSKRLVTGLLRNGLRNKDGKVWTCKPCEVCRPMGRDYLCPVCNGTHLECVEPIPVPDERQYFELCGVPWTEPARRF